MCHSAIKVHHATLASCTLISILLSCSSLFQHGIKIIQQSDFDAQGEPMEYLTLEKDGLFCFSTQSMFSFNSIPLWEFKFNFSPASLESFEEELLGEQISNEA